MGPRVLLGVGGGIAAYKVCELLRLFTESGHGVRVVPTAAALRFVGEPTWAALSGQPVATEVFTDAHEVPHVRLGREADLVVVAPATADLLARAAGGFADDLLTSALLTARCPVLYAPAMHTEMWEHPATVANVATLRSRGATVLDPAVGRTPAGAGCPSRWRSSRPRRRCCARRWPTCPAGGSS
jgi:phosphopantothenoylcysteine decarboxylase/phosphopantothenate--cysteine ligase